MKNITIQKLSAKDIAFCRAVGAWYDAEAEDAYRAERRAFYKENWAWVGMLIGSGLLSISWLVLWVVV